MRNHPPRRLGRPLSEVCDGETVRVTKGMVYNERAFGSPRLFISPRALAYPVDAVTVDIKGMQFETVLVERKGESYYVERRDDYASVLSERPSRLHPPLRVAGFIERIAPPSLE